MSFTKAALELHLTQGAISRQIQLLEQRLGVPLFKRRHKEISLTPAGVVFKEAIAQSLDTIRRAVSVIENNESRSVIIRASVAMSSYWLMPGLFSFKDEQPDINIRILALDQAIDSKQETADLVIRYGDGRWDGLDAIKLFDEEIFPVCAPQYLIGKSLDVPGDLINEELIALDSNEVFGSVRSWSDWFHLVGHNVNLPQPSIRVSNYDLSVRAACAGKGIALAWRYGVKEELSTGKLVRPIPISALTGNGEYLIVGPGCANNDDVMKLVRWLNRYAEETLAATRFP